MHPNNKRRQKDAQHRRRWLVPEKYSILSCSACGRNSLRQQWLKPTTQLRFLLFLQECFCNQEITEPTTPKIQPTNYGRVNKQRQHNNMSLRLMYKDQQCEVKPLS